VKDADLLVEIGENPKFFSFLGDFDWRKSPNRLWRLAKIRNFLVF
jgi:hypothetical protein